MGCVGEWEREDAGRPPARLSLPGAASEAALHPQGGKVRNTPSPSGANSPEQCQGPQDVKDARNSISAHSGCHKKSHRPSGFNFLKIISGSYKSKIRAPAGLVSDESLLSGSQTVKFSLSLHREEGPQELSGVSL